MKQDRTKKAIIERIKHTFLPEECFKTGTDQVSGKLECRVDNEVSSYQNTHEQTISSTLGYKIPFGPNIRDF